jgi:hypothetical protein
MATDMSLSHWGILPIKGYIRKTPITPSEIARAEGKKEFTQWYKDLGDYEAHVREYRNQVDGN